MASLSTTQPQPQPDAEPETAAAATLAPGFADPVHGAQRVFDALMHAMARPGRLARPADLPDAPEPLFATTGAVLLAMSDYDSPVWLDATVRDHQAAVDWLAFHTGAPRKDAREAAHFAVLTAASQASDLDGFAPGVPDYPDRSTTILLQVASLGEGGPLTLSGPGIETMHRLGVDALPAGFVAWWEGNRAVFPLGVDLILCAPDAIVGLPRTVHISETP